MYGVFFVYKNFIEPPDLDNLPKVTELHPEVAEKKDLLVKRAAEQGITILITSDFRSIEEQNKLYEKGRSLPGNIVTYARGGESLHNFGLAIDFAILIKEGTASWDMNRDGNGNGKADWMEVVSIAKELGFEWGGDWNGFKDYAHLEINFGYSLWELQKGQLPSGLK
nr:M15 family metallopeptidase [Peribacillus saganii]